MHLSYFFFLFASALIGASSCTVAVETLKRELLDQQSCPERRVSKQRHLFLGKGSVKRSL
jgi:hypothetical protein